MSIGSITGIGKQNSGGSSQTGLILKKIQKDDKSFCFLADDTVVDFASLVNFITSKGGNMTYIDPDGYQTKMSSISCSSSFKAYSDIYLYFALYVQQSRESASSPWTTYNIIFASAIRRYSNTIGAYDTNIDNTWTVVNA